MSVSSQAGYRLSPEQTRIWSHISQGHCLNTYSLVKIKSSVGLETLENALKILSEHVDIVRTQFSATKERKYPLQMVQKDVVIPVNRVSLDSSESVQDYVNDRSNTVLDHESGPLIQVELLQTPTDSFVLIVASAMLFDSGSMASIWSVIDQLCSGTLEQQEILQYPQIADWQHSLIQEAEDDVRTFWNTYPHHVSTNRSWSVKSDKKATRSNTFVTRSVKLSQDLESRLQEKAGELQTDITGLITVFLADYLGRYSGSDHLNLCVIDPVRSFDELKDIIGNLSVTIPWRYDKPGNMDEIKLAASQLQHIREYSLYFDSEKMSLDSPKTPVSDFEIHLPVQIPVLEHFEIEQIVSMRGCQGLQCSILDTETGMTVQWTAQESIVSAIWLEELAHQTSDFLRWSTQHAGTEIWKNTWISTDIQSQVARLSGVLTDKSEVPLLIDVLDSTFRTHAPAMAVVHGMKWLNYKQVQQQSLRIARNLVSQQITRGSRVGILLPRGIDATLAILGVVQAGACYVPIDTEYPDSRILFMMEDAELALLITTPEFKSRFDTKINCKEVSDLLVAENPETKLPVIQGNDPVYCIFTSGSTGTPKGCVITHDQLSWYLDWSLNVYFDGISGSSVPLFTSLAFDLTVTTIFGSLISGNCLTIFDESVPLPQVLETVFDPNATTEILKMTPAHALVLATTPVASTGIKRVIIGGEVLLPLHVDTLLNLNPQLVIYNEYGPTETVVGCSVDLIQAKDEPITIGTPVSHASMYVVDANMNLMPVGVPGELVIGGKSVSQGYYNRKELTDSRFVTLPFNGERVYRSGDLAYLQHDRTFMFLGRTDSQVKIRGYRIELDEIRTQLQQIPGVMDAFVTTSTYTDDAAHLVGYVVTKQAFDEEHIQAKLSETLPAYMVPSFILHVDSIPLTINGKVDVNALPDLASYLQQKKRTVRHPENSLQHDLSRIWKEVLAIDELSIDDHFFDLGGHSLKAMQIVSRIQNQLQHNLLLSDFFDHLTIEKLEKHLSGGLQCLNSTIPKSKEASSYPSSGPQKRLWVLDKLPGAKRAYHVSEVFQLKGKLDVPAFNHALRTMISRHEVLRTSFRSENHIPRQVVHQDISPMVEFIDATHTIYSETWIEQVTQAVIQTPFDLGSPTLFRSVLIQTAESEYRWVSCMHHIVSDGWSVDIMLEEIQELYLAKIEDRPPRVPALQIQYKDVSTWMERRGDSPEYQASQNYWFDRFKSVPEPVTFPIQKARPKVKTYHGAAIRRNLGERLVKQLKSLKSEGYSTFFGLTAALSLSIYRFLDKEELVIGTPVAGRFLPEMEPLIGFFVNVVPLKLTFKATDSVQDILNRTRATVLEALEYQDVSFDTWTSTLNHPADPSRSPLFDLLIVYHNNPASNWKSPGFTIQPVPFEEKHSKYDLVFEFTERPDSIEFRVDYNTDLFDSTSINDFCDYVERVALSGFDMLNTSIQELPGPTISLEGPQSDKLTSLPLPDPVNPDPSPKKSNQQEALLAAWRKALGRDEIDITDNFFSLGGDSIKAIQLAASLFQDGYRLPIATLFSYPTVQELESRLIEVGVTGTNEPVFGDHPPTPIQQWLLQQNESTRNGFYQTALLNLKQPIPLPVIHWAWQQLMMHHDALRSRVNHHTDSTEIHIPTDTFEFGFEPIEVTDAANVSVSGIAANWLRTRLESFTIQKDPLCQLLVISSETQRTVFIAIHHLVVDILSWRIILEDFNRAISAIMRSGSVEFPAKSTSFLEWASSTQEALSKTIGQQAADFWTKQSRSLTLGLLEHQHNQPCVSTTFEIPNFNETVNMVARIFQASVSDVLMTALSRVFLNLDERSTLTFALEGHGRDLLSELSVDRTVGWFTSEFPVEVTYHEDMGRHLREVKESRIKAERYGGWFMSVADTGLLNLVQRQGIGINFLGELSLSADPDNLFELITETSEIDSLIESRLSLGKQVSLVAHIADNTLLVQVNSSLTGNLESTSVSEALKTEIHLLVEVLLQGSDGPVNTPSDFDYEGLDMDSLDDLLNSIK